MSQYFSIINVRTLYTMIISVLVPVICYEYDVIYDIDLTLISIAIIFPLVFAIRGAFRRREKALEHLSKIRSSLMSIKFGFMTNEKLTKDAPQKQANKHPAWQAHLLLRDLKQQTQ